jgi:1-acyl-sn-glycerol-3-phosphate acyltransferase
LLYWVLKWFVFLPVIRLLFRPWITGKEHVPASGPAILVANHISAGDTYLLPALVPRKVTFPAKAEAFEGKGLRGRVLKWFLEGVGMLPMDRSGGRASATSMTGVLGVLERGELLGIFPEGTRSPDGRLHKGKTGVARIALEAGVPVIPVAMIGTDKVNPIGSKMWRPRRLEIRFGKPLDFSRYQGLQGDRFVERSITDEIMYALMELSGQEYVDIYAARAKELMAAEAAGVRPAVPAQSVREAERVPETKAS